jgi:4-hydroxy-tetrahydrodipicolinate synthase
MELGRIGTAMVTPFSHSGDIDYDLTEQLIEHLIATGTDSLIVCGTTGESPTLNHQEKSDIFKYAIEIVRKRIPVFAGTGTFNTAETVKLTKLADELGADGIMLVTPYYNKPDQKGMVAHFTHIASVTDLPILLYNIPGRAAVNMEAETVIELSKVKNIRGVKEASGSLDQMAEIISGTDSGFKLYSGDDALTLPVLAIGGDGVISVASHIVGNEMQQMINAFTSGETSKAAEMHRTLTPLFNAVFSAPNPIPVKYALAKMGIDTGGVRMPLVSGFKEGVASFDKIWNTFKENERIFH